MNALSEQPLVSLPSTGLLQLHPYDTRFNGISDAPACSSCVSASTAPHLAGDDRLRGRRRSRPRERAPAMDRDGWCRRTTTPCHMSRELVTTTASVLTDRAEGGSRMPLRCERGPEEHQRSVRSGQTNTNASPALPQEIRAGGKRATKDRQQIKVCGRASSPPPASSLSCPGGQMRCGSLNVKIS